MAKTRDPDARSFHGFACYITECLEDAELLYPSWDSAIDPSLAEDQEDQEGRAFLVDQRRRSETFCASLRTVEELRLKALGLSEEQLQSPAAQEYIRENALREQLRYIAEGRVENFARPPKLPRAGEPWRPARNTVCDVIVGTHLVFSGGNRVRTANALNRGIPRGAERGYGVKPSNVRDAITTWSRALDGRLNEAISVGLWLCALRVRALDGLWNRIAAAPEFDRVPTAAATQQLASSGRLFDWHAEELDLVEQNRGGEPIDPVAADQILAPSRKSVAARLEAINREIARRAAG